MVARMSLLVRRSVTSVIRRCLWALPLMLVLIGHHPYSVFGMPSVCDSEQFEVIDECVCPGYTTAVYKCTAVGSGFTQWGGSAFSCPNIGDEIFLSHNDFNDGIRKECNNGAITGQSIRVNGSCFTSLLTVNSSANLNGATIGCTYDTGSTLQLIGETILANRTDSLSPPENVRLIEIKPELLIFSWTPVSFHCSAMAYEIQSSCGRCPAFTNSTSVACVIPSSPDRVCRFAVRSVMCNNIVGGWSNEIEVILRVPNPPMLNISSRYGPSSLLGLDLIFSHLSKDSFNISSGFDGSVIYYTITFSDSITGEICTSTIILPSSCSNVCVSSLPLSCFPLSGSIIAAVSATNVLGEGPTNLVVIDNTNQYARVTAESTGKVVCTFLNQQDVQAEKSCSVLYGRCAEQLSYYTTVQSRAASITVQLDVESDLRDYCYATIAKNDTFSVLIEGNFISTLNNDRKSSDYPLVVIISVIVALTIIVILCITLYWLRKFRKRRRHQSTESATYNDTNSTEPPDLADGDSYQGAQVLPDRISHQVSLNHEAFHAHCVFDLTHKPWKLLSALKLFKDLNINIVDTRIITVNKETRRIYIQFEKDPSMTEIESIYKNGQEMTNPQIFQPAHEFIDIHDESETKGCAVYKYKRQFPPRSGSLYKLLEGINELSQRNSHYDLINIWGITAQPSSDNDGSTVVELQFVRELPSNWIEEFNKITL